jgi:hypothetical protein
VSWVGPRVPLDTGWVAACDLRPSEQAIGRGLKRGCRWVMEIYSRLGWLFAVLLWLFPVIHAFSSCEEVKGRGQGSGLQALILG